MECGQKNYRVEESECGETDSENFSARFIE